MPEGTPLLLFRPFVWAEIDALYGEQERMSSACSALWRSQSSKEVWHTIHFLEDLELIVSLSQLLSAVNASVRRTESMKVPCCLAGQDGSSSEVADEKRFRYVRMCVITESVRSFEALICIIIIP